MRVKVDSNFVIRGVFGGGEVELEGTEPTLRDLLQLLSQKTQGLVTFIDPETGDMDPRDFRIQVNGSPFGLLPQKLDSRLQTGDQVSITMYPGPLGGG